MPWPIRDELDEAAGLAHDVEHRLGNLQTARLTPRTDVVHVAGGSLMENEIDRPAVVLDVDEVPHRGAVVVQWEPQAIHRVGDQDRDELFRVLVWTVVVGAAGHQQR